MLFKSILNLKYAIYNFYINNINECNQSNNHVDYFSSIRNVNCLNLKLEIWNWLELELELELEL